METKKKKGVATPRYDDAFKAGAVQMVTVQGRQPTEAAREPGICIDTLRSWLKAAGAQMGQVSRSNRDQQRIKELESFPLRLTAMCRSGADFVAAATGQVSLLRERFPFPTRRK